MSIKKWQVLQIECQIQEKDHESLDQTLTELSIKNINFGSIVIDKKSLLEYGVEIEHVNVDVIKVLIKHHKIMDINKKYVRDETILLDACYQVNSVDKEKQAIYASIIKLLIESGADCDVRNSYGFTCLMRVARMPKSQFEADRANIMSIIKLLIDHGADRDVMNKSNETAGILASRAGNDQIVNFLRDYKVDHELDLEIADSNISDKLKSRLRGLIDGDKPVELDGLICQLKVRGIDLDTIKFACGYTMLYLAAKYGQVECVRVLIKYQVDPCVVCEMECALSRACLCYSGYGGSENKTAYYEIIRLLIAHGSNCNYQSESIHLYTPLMRICDRQICETDTTEQERMDIIRSLIDNGADRTVVRGSTTAVKVARASEYPAIADFVRDYRSDSVKAVPIEPAVSNAIAPAPAVSNAIAPAPAVSNEPAAPSSSSSSSSSSESNTLVPATVIKIESDNINPVDLELDREITNFGASGKVLDKLQNLISNDKSVDLDGLLDKLKTRGVDLNTIKFEGGYTMLYIAADRGHIACVSVLIKYQVDIHAICDYECALSQACFQYEGCGKYEKKVAYSQIIRLLIANGANCNYQSRTGGFYPPLMRICGHQMFNNDETEQDRIGIVKLLIDHGADRTVNMFGQTAERIAREHEFLEIANIVRDYKRDRGEPVAPVPVPVGVPVQDKPESSNIAIAPATPSINIQDDQHDTIKYKLDQDIIIAKLKNELLELNCIGAETTVAISQWCLQKMDNDIEIEKKRAELAKLNARAHDDD